MRGTVVHRKRWELFGNCRKGGKRYSNKMLSTLMKFLFLIKKFIRRRKNRSYFFTNLAFFCYRASFSKFINYIWNVSHSYRCTFKIEVLSRFNWQYRITRSTSPLLFNAAIHTKCRRVSKNPISTHTLAISLIPLLQRDLRVPVCRERGSLIERSTNGTEWASIESSAAVSFSPCLSKVTVSPAYMKYTAKQYFKISRRNNTVVLSTTLQLLRRTTIKIQRTRSFAAGVEPWWLRRKFKHRAYT